MELDVPQDSRPFMFPTMLPAEHRDTLREVGEASAAFVLGWQDAVRMPDV